MSSPTRLQLEVIAGPNKGQRVILVPGTPLIVGRGSDAGLSIPDDPTISRHHFEINLQPPDCRLKSLSSNGTRVNKDEVTEILLIDGDEIRIGSHSVFRVRTVEESAVDLRKTPRPAGREGLPTFAAQDCPSGTTRFRTLSEAVSALQLFRGLARQIPPHAIVDFKRIGLKPPEGLDQNAVLFDWLPAEVALEHSPLLVDASAPEFDAVLTAGWGQNAIVLIFSKLEAPALCTHLRSALKFDSQGIMSPHAKGLLGICWPSVLEQLLAIGSPALAENLTKGISAVVLETAETPSQWQIYAAQTFSGVMEELGFQSEAPTKAGKLKK